MKRLLFFSILILTVALVNPIFSQNKPVKKPDHSEFSLASRSQQVNGQFNDATPVIMRAYDIDGYDGTCQYTDGVFSGDFKYVVYTITANTDCQLVLTLNGNYDATNCASDLYVYCYCHPFDPDNTDMNYYAEDDDDGTGFNAAFTPADNIQLQAGQSYDIVCTHWCEFTGDGLPVNFMLSIDSDVTIEGLPPVETPVSNWAIGIGIMLILTAMVIRIKRIS
jgi:hypothetical protein